MEIFLFLHNSAPLETKIDFQVFIVYTEIGIGREEKLLDHVFLKDKKLVNVLRNECLITPRLVANILS